MALLLNTNPDSAISKVEFLPVPEGNSTFLHLKPGADSAAVKQWLADTGQCLSAETQMGNHNVLVTHGDKTQKEITEGLKEHGEILAVPEAKKKVNLWKLRGWASMIGQPLQLFSGYLAKGPPDVSTMGFAALNITANASNIFFGQQDENDVHHLRKVKKDINALLEPNFAEDATALDINDHRAMLRKTNETKSAWNKFYDFAKHNSVTIGEIGLRYLAAIALVLPVKKAVPGGDPNVLTYNHWKKGSSELLKGEFKTAFQTLKNNDRATLLAGLTYIGGKSIALMTKPEDPYNPKEPGLWDKFRQKVAFRLSSVIETGAAAIIALDRLNLIKIKNAQGVWKPRNISYDKLIDAFKGHAPEFLKKKAGQFTKRDWLGGIGGLLFTGGLIIRIFAPFGVKKVDMEEVQAHTSDCLAMVPAEKLPQALADTSAYLTEHFKNRKLEFGEVYMKLAKDLQDYHHIAVPRDAGVVAADTADIPPKPFTKDEFKKPNVAAMARPGSYQELAASTVGTGQQLGA